MEEPGSGAPSTRRRSFRWRGGVWILLPVLSAAGLFVLGVFPRDSSGALGRRPLVIGIVGDQTASHDLDASYAILERGVEVLAARRPDVVLHVGDLVESTLPPGQVRTQFGQAVRLLDRLQVPWYLTAGDHDVSPPGFAQNSADRSREKLFQELYGERLPAFRTQPYYSFDVDGGFHFIALYSHQALRADPRWGNIFLARIRDDQLAWLERDLAAHRRARAIIVFLHQPLWYHWSGWRKVHTLLRQYPVAAVVAGHFHYDQDDGEIDGIRYMIVGATGGITKLGSRDAGDLHHVTLLRVAGPRQVQAELLPVAGGGPLVLTPREDMDRVQALHVQLGNLWDFAANNSVFLEGGRLVAACGGGPPARLRMTQIGNPVDVPLEVEIDLVGTPNGATLGSPQFASGACAEMRDGGACVLAPAARTEVSNYSSVGIEGLCPCAPPPQTGCACAPAASSGTALWEAAVVSQGEPPTPGTVLKLRIRTRFAGVSGPLFLEETVSTTVQACPSGSP